jgi:hypothetical protein
MRSASGGGFDGKVCASYYVVSTLSHITHNLSTWGRLVSSRIIGEETLARMNHVVVQSRCLDAKFRYTGFASERLNHMPVVDDKFIGLYSTQRTSYK